VARIGHNGFWIGGHNDVAVPYLWRHGTEEQKRKYLRLCLGEYRTAIVMTEPDAGSDLQGSAPPRGGTATTT